MSAYNDLAEAIAGLKADSSGFSRVESLAAYEDIEFGAPVFAQRGEDNRVSNLKNDLAKIVFDIDFEASNSAVFTIDGVALTAVVYATSHDNTMDLCVAAIIAAGYECALDAADTNNRTLYIQKDWTTISASVVVTLGTNQPVGTVTLSSQMVFMGIALFVQKYVEAANDAKYYQYDTVSVLSRGVIWTNTAATVEANEIAYMVTSGANIGKYSTSGTDINCTYNSSRTGAGLVKVEVNGKKELATEVTGL